MKHAIIVSLLLGLWFLVVGGERCGLCRRPSGTHAGQFEWVVEVSIIVKGQPLGEAKCRIGI